MVVTAILTMDALCAGLAPPNKATKYIVVDHVERIAETDLLAVLLKAKEITGATSQSFA